MTPHFTPTHHAMLLACLVRALESHFGEQGLDAGAEAVRHYGEQRGRRMAMRTRLDGFTPDLMGYLLYGEWTAEPGTSESAVTALWPEAEMQCVKCPWHALWAERELLAYGRVYCQEVDAALARGYCGMTLRTTCCLSRGDGLCRFVFEGQGVPPEKQGEWQDRARRLGDRAKMPWAYHCAHLYASFLAVAHKRLGVEGETACAAGLRDFGDEYGPEHEGYILRHGGGDFESLPPYQGIGPA